MLMNYLAVWLGAGFGGVGRFWLGGIIARRFGEAFPLGTLVINVTGSFLISFFATATGPDGRWLVSPRSRTFFMTGICGGYTTFSSFSLQTLTLAQDGEWGYAWANAGLSLGVCLLAAWLGNVAALSLKRTKGL
jgi:fluoride exporter